MMQNDEHLANRHFQAYLDGDLEGERLRAVEHHLVACARCSAEMEGWRVLFRDLEQMPELEPSPDFRERVVAGVAPPPAGRLSRMWAAIRGRPGQAAGRHPSQRRVQDFIDGLLPLPDRRRLDVHLSQCSPCRLDAEGWKALFQRLDGLGPLDPPAGFAERVLIEFRARQAAQPAPPFAARVSAAARNALVLPKRPRARWLVGGLVTAPIVGFLLVVSGLLIARPTLSLEAVGGFLGRWAADAIQAGSTGLVRLIVETVWLSDAVGVLQAALSSPGWALAWFGVLWLSIFAAASVLYLTVIAPTFGSSRHVQASS